MITRSIWFLVSCYPVVYSVVWSHSVLTLLLLISFEVCRHTDCVAPLFTGDYPGPGQKNQVELVFRHLKTCFRGEKRWNFNWIQIYKAEVIVEMVNFFFDFERNISVSTHAVLLWIASLCGIQEELCDFFLSNLLLNAFIVNTGYRQSWAITKINNEASPTHTSPT